MEKVAHAPILGALATATSQTQNTAATSNTRRRSRRVCEVRRYRFDVPRPKHQKRGSRKTPDIPTGRRMSRATLRQPKRARSIKLRAPNVDP